MIFRGIMSNACIWCGGDCYITTNENMTYREYRCIECQMMVPKERLYLKLEQDTTYLLKIYRMGKYGT